MFRVTVTNAGDGPADHVRLQGRFDDGLEAAGKAGTLDQTIATLAAGQSKAISVPLTAKRGGTFKFDVAAAGDRGLTAVPQVGDGRGREAQPVAVGPRPGPRVCREEATWQLVVRNTGDVPLNNLVVKATLPAEVAFGRATDGGKASGKQVVWNVATLAAQQDRTITITGTCKNVATRTADRDGDGGGRRPGQAPGPGQAGRGGPRDVGVPALQLSVKDSADPVAVGQRTTYLIRVKNAGTQAAKTITVVADLPDELRPTRGTGQGAAATVAGQRVTFRALDSLAPGAGQFRRRGRGRDRRRRPVPGGGPRHPRRRRPALEPTRIVVGQGSPFER